MTAVWTVVILAAVVLAYYGMWRGWQHRVRRTSVALPNLPPMPGADQRGRLVVAADGVYVSTTTEGDWLDRVAAHGLGTRALGSLAVHEHGLLFSRGGEPALWVPSTSVLGVRDERAQAGKVLPGGGIVLVTWQLTPARLDTGFAPRRHDDRAALMASVSDLLRETSS